MTETRLKEAERAVKVAMAGNHQTGEERFNMLLLAVYDLIQWALWMESCQQMLLELHKAQKES